MKKSKTTEQAWELINQASTITLLTHFKPDGDGIGACLALELVLTRLGKTVETVYPNAPEFEFSRQPQSVLINKHTRVPDLLIACDAANYDRLYFPDEFKVTPLINIDHHVSNSLGGTCAFVFSETSSACEVLFELFSVWDASLIDKHVADALLFGILYDSRMFRTQSTHPSTLRIAADLMELGADLFQLKVELLAHKSPKVFKLWELLISRMKVSEEKSVAWSYFVQDDLRTLDLTLSSLIGFNDFLADISGIDISLLFYETESGKTKVSLRSKTYDVNALAAKFGGGGHKNAAGILTDTSIDVLMTKVVETV